ncbi:MAG: SDR family oxidoreductase [Bowdeniella nasicola]|nr:SDR family oxidoreductase [Bowdeniella nasicola]
MGTDQFSLHGTTTLITGGHQGIGKVVAAGLAARGSGIAIMDRQDASHVADDIRERFDVPATAVIADVTDPEAVASAITQAHEELGGLNHLFNNAGIVLHKPALDCTPDDWRKVINVNLTGVFFVAQAFARYLIAEGRRGNIVNTASMSGTIVNTPQPQASYNASKAGVAHLTKSLAVEWQEHGIRVNSISPGYIETELIEDVRKDWRELWESQIPFKRMGTPEELVGAVTYLLSDASSYTSGTDLIIDGLFTTV